MGSDQDKIDEIHRELSKQGSLRHKLWSGVIFGIGSTLGVAIILYVAVLLFQQLQDLPFVGRYFGTVTPTLERTLEDRVPSLPSQPTTQAEPEPTTTETDETVGTGATQMSTNHFSLTLPAGWDVTLNEGSKGVQRSRLQAQSDDFVRRVDESVDGPFLPIYYEDGAALAVSVTTVGNTDHGGIISQKSVTLDGMTGTYHVFTEPSTSAGQQVDVHAVRGSLAYTLTFTYNPDVDPDGAAIFDAVLASFRFAEPTDAGS